MSIAGANIPSQRKQVLTGLLLWAFIWIINKAVISVAVNTLPPGSHATVELCLKAFNLIASMLLIFYTVKKWHWNLDDWGFGYDLGFWICLAVACVFVGTFWYLDGMPTAFTIQTLRQALTGVWEELISTVFFTLLLIKFFGLFTRFNTLSAKTLAVVFSAIVFTLIHYGRWTMGEVFTNTAAFLVYRAVYAFVGTSLVGITIHGTSNGNAMSFPLLLAFYAGFAILNWRSKIRNK